jgi:hypothetical protein
VRSLPVTVQRCVATRFVLLPDLLPSPVHGSSAPTACTVDVKPTASPFVWRHVSLSFLSFLLFSFLRLFLFCSPPAALRVDHTLGLTTSCACLPRSVHPRVRLRLRLFLRFQPGPIFHSFFFLFLFNIGAHHMIASPVTCSASPRVSPSALAASLAPAGRAVPRLLAS